MIKSSWKENEVMFLRENYEKSTSKVISEKLQRSISSVKCKLKHLNLKRTNRKWSDKDIEYLINNLDKDGIKKISLKLDRTYAATQRRCQILRIKRSRSCYTRKYFVNSNYFDHINNISCYIAGFIAADGCISFNGNNRCLKLYLKNGLDEVFLLHQIKKELNYTGPIYCRRNNSILEFSINDNIICNDLEKLYNITPRKSLNLKPPNVILNKDNLSSYLLGIFDGDGCLYSKKFFKIDWTSASLVFIEWIKQSINDNFNINGNIVKNRTWYRLDYYGSKGKSLITQLQQNAPDVFRLRRKIYQRL